MNKTLRLTLLSLLMMVCGGVFADSYSYEFTAKTFEAADNYELNDVTWKIATDAGYWGYDATKGQQIGSSSNPGTKITLSTSGISGTITSVKVTTSGAKNIAGTLKVTVGGDAFGDAYTLTSTSTETEFTGSASGEIVLKWEQIANKAIYIKKIEVTYEATAPTPIVVPDGTTVTYALQAGDAFTAGQTVDVIDPVSTGLAATITYGFEGGANFNAASANNSVSGFAAFTSGNGENGSAKSGTTYIITPKYNGQMTVGVCLNANKAFYVLEDEVALTNYNGIKVDEKYYGTYTFNVKANSVYKVYCTGSKLGFYGFNFTTSAAEPEPEPQPEQPTKEVALKSGMFYNWNGYGADAEKTTPAGVEFNLGTELSGGGVVCGTSTVDYLIYADLTGCKKMIFEGTDGLTLRVLMNRQESNSGPLVEKKATISEGVAKLDLTDMEYIHLNAIKLDYNGVSGSVNAIKLVKPYDPNAPVEYLLNTDFASLEAWTPVVSGGYRDFGNGKIGEYTVRFSPATVDASHLATEYCIGMECRWSGNLASFTQTSAEPLPAGKYALTYDVQNVNNNTASANYENRFTVTVGKTVYTDQATEWMNSGTSWTKHSISFELTEESDITVSLGYGTGSNNISADNTPALYVSHLQLTDLLTANRATLQAEIDASELLLADASNTEGRTEFEAAINTAKGALALTDADEVLAAVKPLKQAVAAFEQANHPVEAGTYYVYNPYSKKFLARGADWGTRAVASDYGTAIIFNEVSHNVFTLKVFDNNAYYGDNYWMYADCTGDRVRQFKAERAGDGIIYLRNTALAAPNNRMYVYMKDDADKFAIANNATLNDNISDEAQTVWQLLTAEEYNAMIAERNAAEVSAAAVEAGYDANTEFVGVGEPQVVTFKSGNAWTATVVRTQGGQPATNANGTEMWQATGNFKQTVENLPSGVYTVSIQAFYRNGGAGANGTCLTSYNTGYNTVQAYLEANGSKAQVKSWAEDRVNNWNPNSMDEAAALFNQGKYTSTTTTYVGEDGKLNLAVYNPAFIGDGWFIASNVTITKAMDKAIYDLQQNLLADINEANTLVAQDFFENGQSDLNNAIAAALALATSEDKAQLEEAINNLQAAMTAFYNANNPETGKYYLKNVGNGMFWGAGNSWGTQASLVEHPEYVTLHKQDNGKYQLESQVSNGGNSYYFNGDFMDQQPPLELTLIKVATKTWTIANGTALFGFDGGSTVLGKNLAEGDNAKWFVLSEADMQATLDAATAAEPADATFLLLDPGYGRNNRNVGAWQKVTGNTTLAVGGNIPNGNAESYMQAYEVKQEAVVPNGVYRVDAQAAVTFHDNRAVKAYDGNGYPVIYAGKYQADFNEMIPEDQLSSQAQMGNKFSAGNYAVTPIYLKVTDGTLTVGSKSHRADIWAVWDNFVLTYYGNDADEILINDRLSRYNPALAEAQAVNGYMNAEVQARLTAAIDADATLDKTDFEAIEAATDELIAATKAALESIAAYAPVKAKLTEIDKVLAYTNVYTTEAYVAFKAQHEAYRTAYKDGTMTTEQAQTLVNDVLPIGPWHKANTIDDLLLSTWSVGDVKAKDYDTSLYINTWSTEGNIDGSNFKAPFFEYWVSDAQTLGANILHADMDELEPGVYDVKARVRVRLSNGQTELQGIKMQLNDGDEVDFAGTQIGTSPLYLDNEMTAQGIVGKDGKLSVKLIVEEGNTASWLAFKDVMVSLNGMETDALQQQLAVEAAKKDLQQLVDEAEELYEDCGIYTAATSGALREALDNAIDGIALDDITVRQLNQLKKALRSAMNALDLRGQSDAMFAVLENDVYASGQQVEVVANDDKSDVAMRITFGVEGGNDFYAGVANSDVDGFTAFTEGNGENGTANGGTVYYLEPQYNGVVTMGIALGKNKRLFIKEDETNKEAFNGQQLDEEFAGTIVFNVKGGSRYTVWAASSKLGFYGLNYEFGDGVEPVDEVNPGIATRIAGVSNDRLNGTVYTISGQKIDNTRNLKKGVYVVNGKKVIF